MSKKLYITIAILLLVVAAAGMFLFVRERPASSISGKVPVDTDGWEAYRSEQYKYEARYPKSSLLTETKSVTCLNSETVLGVPDNLISEIKNNLGGGYLLGPCFLVHEVENPQGLPITDWMGVNRADIIGSADLQQDITFQGKPALLLEREDRGFEEGKYAYNESTIYFFHNGNLFSIRSIAPPENPMEEWRAHPYYQYLEKSVPVTQAIIESFRFVE